MVICRADRFMLVDSPVRRARTRAAPGRGSQGRVCRRAPTDPDPGLSLLASNLCRPRPEGRDSVTTASERCPRRDDPPRIGAPRQRSSERVPSHVLPGRRPDLPAAALCGVLRPLAPLRVLILRPLQRDRPYGGQRPRPDHRQRQRDVGRHHHGPRDARPARSLARGRRPPPARHRPQRLVVADRPDPDRRRHPAHRLVGRRQQARQPVRAVAQGDRRWSTLRFPRRRRSSEPFRPSLGATPSVPTAPVRVSRRGPSRL